MHMPALSFTPSRVRDIALVAVIAYLAAGPAVRAFGQASPGTRVALATGFTYQGRLVQGGVPAEGAHDFEFSLWTAESGGSKVGETVVADNLVVTNGLFAVQLDFGQQFDGTPRWLEVVADGASLGRTELTATPHAIFASEADRAEEAEFAITADVANSAPWAGVTGKPGGFADDVDNDLLATMACSDGQVAKFGAGAWSCGTDEVGPSYTAGAGLSLSPGNAFSVNFGGDGVQNSAARSDHNHLGEFWIGNTSNGLQVSVPDGTGLSGQAGNGIGHLGHKTAFGTFGVAGGTGAGLSGPSFTVSAGVFGSAHLAAHYGVFGYSTQYFAVWGESGTNDAVVGRTGVTNKAGIVGIANGGPGTNFAGYFQGNISVDGTVTNTSDVRLKRDITPLDPGLDEVMDLRPVRFAWDGNPEGGHHLGFLAQDVQEVLPELVSEGRDGYLGVNYDGLIPVLARAIQEQQAEIEALRGGVVVDRASAEAGGPGLVQGVLMGALVTVAGAVVMRARAGRVGMGVRGRG